ncbi:helix-turn-helix domain-containing protein [Cystobacter fuscus]
MPRATWTHLESGSGNPTLSVLLRVASSLQTSVEELLGAPRQEARLVKRASSPRAPRATCGLSGCCRTACRASSSSGWTFPARACSWACRTRPARGSTSPARAAPWSW